MFICLLCQATMGKTYVNDHVFHTQNKGQAATARLLPAWMPLEDPDILSIVGNNAAAIRCAMIPSVEGPLPAWTLACWGFLPD